MPKFSPMHFILLIFLLNSLFASILNPDNEHNLPGGDELEDSLEAMISETELTPKYAIIRVRNLQNIINTVRQKCTKYLYVIKNYISFYQMRKKYQVQKDSDALLAQLPLVATLTSENPQSNYQSFSPSSRNTPFSNNLPSINADPVFQIASRKKEWPI